jgi:hypothetical protein
MGGAVRVVSGGQTGVDRAALDAALANGLEIGGWCPAGRWAEDGMIAAHYPLRETPDEDPRQRTAWNVRDSDATWIIVAGESRESPGTARTIRLVAESGKPLLVTVADASVSAEVRGWIDAIAPGILNIAGPRESEVPGIYAKARALVSAATAP